MTSATKIEHPSIDERRAKGKKAREDGTSAHAGWKPAEIAPTRSRCSRSRMRPVSPTWCRCATAG